MTGQDLELYRYLSSSTEASLMKTLPEVLKKYYHKIAPTEHYIYASGTIPILLVAHLDTVHSRPVKELYHDTTQRILWSPQGLGADDRAGVFAILKILKKGYRPSVLFTTKEEIGGKGAQYFLHRNKKPPTKINFIIELDRQGQNDCVFYDLDNKEFESYISSFGFKIDVGIFSDVTLIGPKWKTVATNLSVGYMHEHSLAELLHYDYLYETIEKVCNILDAEIAQNHKFSWKKYSLESVLTNG